MENCVVCNHPFRISGNFNTKRQLTCKRPSCQRALKTMKQHWRRSQKAKKRGKGKSK
jgi:hypothetical protein